ncbi:MAG: amino acid ABC transporter substrate-binding protein [Actinobacteria bacterium]|nr:amino acid ABC transporter substrate-binding protein [Actinomycetota bacterium]
MKKNRLKVAVVALAASVSLVLTSCSSSSSDLFIASDLPLQGGSADQSKSTNNAIKLLLKQMDNKAGEFSVGFREYDNSTAAKGSWDDAQCAKNAQAHVAAKDEVGVMGTYNSGCAKIIVPVLNQDPEGPMVMISNANTNPGLTKAWDAGEPEKYYPTGQRNYFRVVTTDDNQGNAAAEFAQSIGTGWDDKAPNYEALFTKIKATKPDMVYVGGIFDLNGGQLVKDKVKYLGDNTKVKFMMPDGFTGYPDFLALPEAQGAYLSFTGLSIDQFPKGGAAEKFQADYLAEYGEAPTSSFSVYGAAAAQVLLAAIAKSDGTRKGVFEAMKGIVIPASESVVGTELRFDANGDIVSRDITILNVTDNKETFVKKITVK